MKNTKKFFALLLTVVMVLSLSVTAFADNSGEKYTITAPDGDHTYEVYQIFTGDLSEGKLSNIKWGANGTGTTGEIVPQTDLEALAAVSSKSDNEKLAVITQYASLSNPITTLSGTTLTYEGVPGYYLIKDMDNSITATDAYTTYVVVVVEDVAFTRKADVPEVTKTVDDKKINSAAVGDTVEYEIVGTMPTNIADFDTYFMQFNDTLTKGLTFNNDLTITVNDVDATNYFYTNATDYDANNGTTITVSIADLLALKNVTTVEEDAEVAVYGPITAATEVVVTYSATVNENAVINGSGNKNDVELVFSNDPNNSGTPSTNPPEETPEDPPTPSNPIGKTPKAETYTYVTELTILKVDEEGKKLTGAEFTLTGTDLLNTTKVTGSKYEKAPYTADEGETVQTGTYYLLTDGSYTTTAPSTEEGANNIKYVKNANNEYDTYVCVNFTKWVNEGTTTTEPVKAFVDGNGKVVFTGLKAGTYTLSESVTPAGYNTVDPITVTIKMDEDDSGTVSFYIDELYAETSVKIMSITVENVSGTVLPETGGIGTTIFYILGGILLVGASVLLITKKRMSVNE